MAALRRDQCVIQASGDQEPFAACSRNRTSSSVISAIVVRIDSHSPREGAEMLLLAVGPLNRFPLVGQLGDAAITDLRDAIQAIVDESCERYLRGIRFKLFCSISNELARHVRHGTGNVRLPFGT